MKIFGKVMCLALLTSPLLGQEDPCPQCEVLRGYLSNACTFLPVIDCDSIIRPFLCSCLSICYTGLRCWEDCKKQREVCDSTNSTGIFKPLVDIKNVMECEILEKACIAQCPKAFAEKVLSEALTKVRDIISGAVNPLHLITPSVCPEGWVMTVCGKCFGSDDKGKDTYKGALQKCKSRGGTLAQPKSKADQDLLVSLCSNNNCPDTWIGLNDIADEGIFLWIDGTPLAYSNWDIGEPNNVEDEDCVHIWGFSEQNTWNDNKCEHYLNFFCEIEASPSLRFCFDLL